MLSKSFSSAFIFIWFLGINTSTLAASKTWTGLTNTDWSVNTNWSDNAVPIASDDVVISDVAANQPIVKSGIAAVAHSIGVYQNAVLTIEATGSLTLNGSASYLGTMAFYNLGTVNNSGRLIIGSISSVGTVGLFNGGMFNNNLGAEIQIDRSTMCGLDNHNTTSVFTNFGKITIGGLANVGDFGLYSHGNFYNHLGGEIQINNSTNTGLTTINGTNVFYNYAKITIGATASVGMYGIQNFGNFRNETTGDIKIDNSSTTGLRCGDYRSYFLNKGQITIGTISNVGEYGLVNLGVFDNNTFGKIDIDRTITTGLYNAGTFNNAARIIIGSVANVGINGLQNNSVFYNNIGGEIKIDRSTFLALSHHLGIFINSAKISIGGMANVGVLGMQSSADFTNDTGGEINIDNAKTGLYVAYRTFTNKARINIGAVVGLGSYGISNEGFINNSGCSALIILN
jgi:hypothetical protein